ncbi:hypothetical protein H6P81_003167 [Aristolochia fimbriata]|uniref:J domain-containing protein n=1 Tax=Aristolochia fimbriata TaxID=158543 RepID=A0AAV7FDI2_ARIFI|nr:hypothetical protein H6P81_003167 [Aristolochia fimbriata]
MQAHFMASTNYSFCFPQSPFRAKPPRTSLPSKKQSRTVLLIMIATATMKEVAVAAAQPITMYDVLSVSESAGREEIKAAYRKLARRCHPDACGAAKKESTEVFIQVREAYRVLSYPLLRQEYDFRLRNYRGSYSTAVVNRTVGGGGGKFSDWEAKLEGLRRKSASRVKSTATPRAYAPSSTS